MHRLPLKTTNVIQNNTKIIKNDLTERDILGLNDILLTPGIHTIQVNSFGQARFVLKKLLNSLNYYSAIACITAHKVPASYFVSNLYRQLQTPDKEIHEFMLDDFYYDFLWIELTPQLSQATWFSCFIDALVEFNFPMTMPIVVLSSSKLWV